MKICIYGASSNEIDPKYIEEIELLGRELASKGYGLVYGGGAQGLMGAAARGFYEKNGEIIGIAPTFFMHVDGVLYDQCSQFILTETMRERKVINTEGQKNYTNAKTVKVVPTKQSAASPLKVIGR